MSQTDQAFIKAYGPRPAAAAPKAVPAEPAPPAPVERTTSRGTLAFEQVPHAAVPAPHFSFPAKPVAETVAAPARPTGGDSPIAPFKKSAAKGPKLAKKNAAPELEPVRQAHEKLLSAARRRATDPATVVSAKLAQPLTETIVETEEVEVTVQPVVIEEPIVEIVPARTAEPVPELAELPALDTALETAVDTVTAELPRELEPADEDDDELSWANAATVVTEEEQSALDGQPAPTEASASGMKPLGERVAAGETKQAWQPSQRVDHLLLSPVCHALLDRAEASLLALAQELKPRIDAGLRQLLLTSGHGNEGATSVTICLAHVLAQLGLRVLLIDEDFSHPGVAEALQLHSPVGFQDVLRGDAKLDAAVVESTHDQWAVLPLRTTGETTAPTIAPHQLRLLLGKLRMHYDLLLIDGGPLQLLPEAWLCGQQLDAAILVQDAHAATPGDLLAIGDRFQAANLEWLGVIENFAV